MKKDCYKCSYFHKEKVRGKTKYYCHDRDCYVNPLEPECNYD